jgi:nitrogenase subunit NifH
MNTSLWSFDYLERLGPSLIQSLGRKEIILFPKFTSKGKIEKAPFKNIDSCFPRSEVIAKCIDEDTEVGVVNDVIQREVEDAYANIQKYLATLNPLRDFW